MTLISKGEFAGCLQPLNRVQGTCVLEHSDAFLMNLYYVLPFSRTTVLGSQNIEEMQSSYIRVISDGVKQ